MRQTVDVIGAIPAQLVFSVLMPLAVFSENGEQWPTSTITYCRSGRGSKTVICQIPILIRWAPLPPFELFLYSIPDLRMSRPWQHNWISWLQVGLQIWLRSPKYAKPEPEKRVLDSHRRLHDNLLSWGLLFRHPPVVSH